MNTLRQRGLRLRASLGFTLVELVSVLIIMGIMAAIAIPRFVKTSSFTVRGFYDQAQSLVRYGQKMAIAQNIPVYVRLNGTSVALCYNATCTSVVTAPAGSNSRSAATLAACSNSKTWACEAPTAGVTYTSANATSVSYNGTNATFYFSPQGKPYNTGDVPPTSGFNSQLTITLTGDGSNHQIFVEQETGYVHP